MARKFATCDLCGRPLAQHENRYVLRLVAVPAYRQPCGRPYDLCPECAGRIREKLGTEDTCRR